MSQQLIVNILGADRLGILSEIAASVCEMHCNILDSRMAIYGEDFSLTMIMEGTQAAITRAEAMLPKLCAERDLLCLAKRTRHHAKQHLAHLAEVEFAGLDAVGVIKAITELLAHYHMTINAFRQSTFADKTTEADMVKCKLMVSLAEPETLERMQPAFEALLDKLGLIGHIKLKQ